MRKRKLINSAVCIILSALVAMFTLTTVLAYSSDSDPIVTLSYLNDVVLPMLREEFSAKNAEDTVIENTDELPSDETENPDNTVDTENNENTEDISGDENTEASESTEESESTDSVNENAAKLGTYELLELNAGQTVLCESAVEIIVRPGSLVTVVSPFEAQGIADITNGNELLSEQEIPINAYCIIPRGKDGRGFYVLSEKAYIMIRGEYTIG